MRVTFNLTKGMKNQELVNELKERVSGESRQEVQSLLTLPQPHPEYPISDLEVIKTDPIREAAIIRKRFVANNLWNDVEIRNDYYVAGINDEGTYFIHPLDGFRVPDWISKSKEYPSLELVLNWLNRTDEGFVKRVQGDILLQFLTYGGTRLRAQEHYAPLIEHPSTKFLEMRISLNELNRIYQRVNGDLELGNHRLSVEYRESDGFSGIWVQQYSSSLDPGILCHGNKLTLQHQEHGIATVDIPKSDFVLLTGQRGRTLSFSSSNRIQGFD